MMHKQKMTEETSEVRSDKRKLREDRQIVDIIDIMDLIDIMDIIDNMDLIDNMDHGKERERRKRERK